MIRFAVAIAIGLALAATASSQTPASKAAKPSLFQRADANKDGKVTFEELKAVMPKITEQRFKEMDKNKDGSLTPNEMPTQQALAQILKQADANKDGKVTYEELKAVRPKMTQEAFNKLDRNKDGVLTKDDKPLSSAAPNTTPAAQESAGKFRQRLQEADTNHDKKVSWEEAQKAFPKMTQERFKKMDKNGDGFISKEDRAASK